MSPRPVLTSLVLWAMLALAVIAGNRVLIFSTEVHETGDFAVNALQIDHAKRFEEIYGNYSRFHFHHPGPVFFYAYAMSERLLFDTLAVVPSPANAHIVAGIVVQCGFFVLALVLLADVLGVRGANAGVGSGRRGAVEAVRGQSETGPTWVIGLLVGALHFGFVKNAITGIWPPEVLLMPFLAFFAAAVSVALGRVDRLPWMILAGSFLVHGHVAQPLFVGTLFLIAYRQTLRVAGLTWRHVPQFIRAHRRVHAIGLVLLAAFLVPLIVDLVRGAPNLRLILLHLHGNGGDGKGPIQSLLFFLSFSTYEEAPERFLASVGSDSFAFISRRPLLFLLWVTSVAIFAWGAHRDRPGALWRLWCFWLTTVCLCIVWGLLQAGPMYSFNGYFYHGINFVAYLAAGCVLFRLVRLQPGVGSAVVAGVVALYGIFAGVRVAEDRIDPRGLGLRASTMRAVAQDPNPNDPKLLVYPHHSWDIAAGVALALHREGVPFRVEPELTFMYQERFVAPRSELRQPDPAFSVWRFVAPEDSTTGPLIANGPGIVFEPAPLAADGGVISFGAEDGFMRYHLMGVSGGENGKSWTKDPDVVLQFRPQAAERDVELAIEARPYIRPRGPQRQRVEVSFNGRLLWQGALTEPGLISVSVPRDEWNRQPVAHLWLHLPDATAPVALGNSGDWRQLALEITQLTTREIAGLAP